MRASGRGHEGIVRLLLGRLAGVDLKCREQQTALHEASAGGHAGVVSLLLELSASVDVSDKDGWTSLHLASHYGHAPVVRVLLAHGANVAIEIRSFSALHFAARENHPAVLELLLSAVFDPRLLEEPLRIAVNSGHAVCEALLRSAGATG